MNPDPGRPIELWGGLECTINRVGDRFIDQLALTGVYDLEPLVDSIAGLGFTRVRWPVLWERVAPDGLARADWSWCDRTLDALRARQIEPIVGLVHHGSGPHDTNLLDPAFPDRLAEYARACAARYPWVRYYTPVNEPLTTARFSALYGHWYPHRHDDRAFVSALCTQLRGVMCAMGAIRSVHPEAALVQTEDAGGTLSTSPLQAQADFENHRRWLSLDLLLGRVGQSHPLREYLASNGMSGTEMEWFEAHAVAPAIVGLNYYVTSDRYLDHRLVQYPRSAHGGNGRELYADVEAARVPDVAIRGHARVLTEAWERYRLPVAITEAHLGCTREEQIRWLRDAWLGAEAARAAGADVRAVTVWALLGSSEWDSLVTRTAGHYEPGPFDLRGSAPRRTALADASEMLATAGAITHPAAVGDGWWTRAPAAPAGAPVMVLGASGTLGQAFQHACAKRGLACVGVSRADLDILDVAALGRLLARHRPWAVINATGYVRVDAAEADRRACRLVNAVAPAVLAMGCRKAGVRFATFSSDLVFDGGQNEPYREEAGVAPLNTYGRTKAEAERRVGAIDPGALVIRTSAFFGPWDRHNFVTTALDHLAAGRPFRAPTDLTVSPTYVPDLVDATLDLLIDGAGGLWHLANEGAVSWFEFARMAAARAGLEGAALDGCSSSGLGLAAVRPRYSVLGTARGIRLPPLDDALDRYIRSRVRTAACA
jgi:dTDP-4-dehydrorhamnose reductase